MCRKGEPGFPKYTFIHAPPLMYLICTFKRYLYNCFTHIFFHANKYFKVFKALHDIMCI